MVLVVCLARPLGLFSSGIKIAQFFFSSFSPTNQFFFWGGERGLKAPEFEEPQKKKWRTSSIVERVLRMVWKALS